MAAQLRGLGAGRPLHLLAQEVEQGVEAGGVAVGDAKRGARPLGEQPARRAGEPLVVEAHDEAAHVVRLRELMDLSLGYQREGARPELHGLAVDQVPALALADPDQLVVCVPVRLAQLAVADAPDVEAHNLEGVRGGGQIVDGGLGH